MKRSLLLLAALSTLGACLPPHAVRAGALLKEGKPEAAAEVWKERLREAPTDPQALAGWRQALTLIAARVHAEASQPPGIGTSSAAVGTRLMALSRVDALVGEGATAPAGLEGTRQTLGAAARALVDEPLGLGQPLEAEARLFTLEGPLRQAGLDAVARAAAEATKRVGARRCVVLTNTTRTPWLGHAVARYCAHFQAKGPEVRGLPERRSTLEFDATPRLQGASLDGVIGATVRAAFLASVWHDDGSPGAATAVVSGALSSRVTAQPMEVTTSWAETEAYQAQEQQTEHYQEMYQAMEQRPRQVSYTAYQSYTYSCGTGTSYRTCSGSRPVTQYRTEYVTESVTKYRPATRQVTRTVTKYRPVTRSVSYPGVQHRAEHSGKVTVALALPGLPAAVEVTWEDSATSTDVEHSMTHGPAKLTPHVAEVLRAPEWEQRAGQALGRAVSEALELAWVRSFCREVTTPELAARCLAAPRAPRDALAGLATFFGEPPELLAEAVWRR